eukprot:TRINITY_DN1236_c0_g1_i1.p1 TRINITY_DN1236_c0_g1~~TRINITY_DN1236_c0_g1_i1.p1  ORF type:complete len:447 (+),score=47.69 TRINITY_DN1236_c0_g1_i1:97-1437(+)
MNFYQASKTSPEGESENLLLDQPTINIGLIGHVAHGKSTLVKALTGIDTVKFDSEIKRNKMTIRLGYANAKIWACSSKECPRPYRYASSDSSVRSLRCKKCDLEMKIIRHVSFVDCPGHDILIATMLNGAAVMDGAMLVVSADKDCPQPQTVEHLAAIDIMGLENIIVCQNKIDVVQINTAVDNYTNIKRFLSRTFYKDSPVVPVSAQQGYNMDVLCEYLIKNIPVPHKSIDCPPLMLVVRSFDVNKPGCDNIDSICGGIAGGSLIRGTLNIEQVVEIRPGLIVSSSDGSLECFPIRTRVVSLYSESNALKSVIPGGLIAVGTNLDPSLARADRLVGHVIGIPGHMPPVFTHLEIQYFLLNRTVGPARVKKVGKLKPKELLKVNVGSMTCNATVASVEKDMAMLRMELPVCCELESKVTLSRKTDEKWRLISFGVVKKSSKELKIM